MKMLFLVLFLSLSLFISGISSFTVINNITVNSDILKEIFFDQIQNSGDIYSFVSESGKYDAKKCFSSLSEIIRRFPDRDVFPFIDAWGHLPSGIAYGGNFDTGEFDQCVTTSVLLSEEIGVVNGQYCFANLALPETFGVNTAICVPDTCGPEYLTAIFKLASDRSLGGAITDIISVGHCTDGKVTPLTTINIVAISIFSIATILMILSSLYEFIMKYYERSPTPILMTFSVFTNAKKLFAINTKRSRNSIDCFNGLRVLSTFWVMLHHIPVNFYLMQNMNLMIFSEFTRTLPFMFFVMGVNAVDTFLFIAGLLIAFNGFRDLDNKKGKMNVVKYIFHRYVRLITMVAIGLLMIYGINNILYIGPFKDRALAANTCDESNWWPVLLLFQNYQSWGKSCYDETWYVAVDFQLFVLSPLLLIAMWKWGKKVLYFVAALIIASTAYVIIVFFNEEFTGFTQGSNDTEWDLTYVKTYARCSPWLIGFVLGYFMHYNRNAEFRISKLWQLLAWIGSIAILLAIIFGPYPVYHAYGKGTVFEAAMYGGLKHIGWAVALVWITFACYYGFGGPVEKLLSHSFWQPLSRLSYALYLFHMAVIKMHYGMSRQPLQFSFYNIFPLFFAAFGTTLMIAIFVTLALESPILTLENFLLGKSKPSKPIGVVQELKLPENINADQINRQK